MNTNNPSNKIKDRDLNEDVNENANERTGKESGNADNADRMQDSSQSSGLGNMRDYRDKGTGMSSESGSSQKVMAGTGRKPGKLQ